MEEDDVKFTDAWIKHDNEVMRNQRLAEEKELLDYQVCVERRVFIPFRCASFSLVSDFLPSSFLPFSKPHHPAQDG